MPSVRRWSAVIVLALVMVSLVPITRVRAATPQYFPETQHHLGEPMLTYWKAHGGLPVFGFPISEAFGERNADTGAAYLTQYLERNRFEAHPENHAPYHVLLGRLGDEALRQQGRDWQTFPKAAPTTPHYFAQSGHAIAHEPFWHYWSSHGLEFDGKRGSAQAESLALFGLPLSEPMVETNASGDQVLTQWFERARFENHGPNGVLLGLLGNETTKDRRGDTPFQPVTKGQQPPAGADDIHRAGRWLFDITNEKRKVESKYSPYRYRDDLQAIGDQIAREWTEARKNGGDAQAVLDRYGPQLAGLAPYAGIILAQQNVPLEAGCKGINPSDPVASGTSPYVTSYQAETLTFGVYGPYKGPCGRAMTVIAIIGY
ncbi:MAG TPA: hypothetical protein VGD69_27620 [Herpetosiphonaceae bacterium]